MNSLLVEVALFVSIILQLVAAGIAISLTRKVRFNVSWFLLTAALVLMAVCRVIDLYPFFSKEISITVAIINTWIGIICSVLFVVALLFIRKFFRLIREAEEKNETVEKRIISAIINTEERERQRFAKDLHDGLGPLLSNLKMSVSAIENIDTRDNMDEILVNMRNVATEALICMKEVSNNLSPHLLENFGLQRALSEFIKPYRSNSNVDFEIKSNFDQQRFSYNTEIVIYRIITELINNTMKHAEASCITIDMQIKGKQLTINYSDNGKGMSLAKINSEHSGHGLSNINSRIKTLYGDVTFVSKPGKGFTSIINCPIN